jgi:O6-methylguanine-DNA--protein-cysteine methyltransferase
MQIVLNIDQTNIGETVEEIFRSLSDEDKKEVAKQVMLETLRKPSEVERINFENELIKSLIKADGYPKTEKDARDSYAFTERRSKFKTSSERMIESISAGALVHYKELAASLVKEDPVLSDAISKMLETFKTEFPNMVQLAMSAYFASQMQGIASALLTSSTTQYSVQDLARKLNVQL